MRPDARTESDLDRRGALVVAGLSLGLLVALAAVLVPWDWVPGGNLTPVRATEVFTAAEIGRAEEHARSVRLISWGSLAVSLAAALLFGLTRMGAVIAARLPGRSWWASVPFTVGGLLLLGSVLTLPFALLIRDRRLEAGLTTQSLAGWLSDRTLSFMVSWLVTSILVLIVVGAARRSPRRWFIRAGGAAVTLGFVGSVAYPVVVEPLFNDFTPLADGPFKESILELAASQGVYVDAVLVSDASRRTTTLNAYVSGIGGTRRIVVYDNLIEDLEPAQARSVIAHELAHARHHDVVLVTSLAALGALFGVCLLALLLDSRRLQRRAAIAGAADPGCVALVLALVAVGGLLASPVQNTVSRAIEARADRTALAATDDEEAFRKVHRQLALRSLADPTPPRWSHLWFGSHPTVLQRLGLPASMERAQR